jgi:type II secretory pathway pseudopilin PulG
MLVGLIVAIFLVLLVLGVAAPKVATQLRREREAEAVHRGNQYIRAIRQYYLKTGHYPGSVEQLEKTSNVRYLRQRYIDPMTGKADWRLIHVGEAKTTVRGFFGRPLSGPSGSGGSLGSVSGMSSSGQGGQASTSGTASSSSSFGSSSFGSSGTSSTSAASTFGSASGSSSVGSGIGVGSSGASGSGINSQSATSLTGTGAPIMGVGSAAMGNSIIVMNEQTSYPTWEFIYDPRVEQLKAASVISVGAGSSTTTGFGSSTSGSGTSGFGSSSFSSGTGNGASTPGTSTPGAGSSPQ